MKLTLTLSFLLIFSVFQLQAQYQEVPYDDLPPNPEYGKCYAKCKAPDVYETFKRRVLVKEQSIKTIKIPAKYETRKERVMVQPGRVDYKTIPATYKTVQEKVMVTPERKVLKEIPAKYKKMTRKVLVAEATGKWVKKKKEPNCFSENPEDCLIACYEKIPAQYATEEYEILESPARTVEEIIPAVYETVSKTVVAIPERTIETPIEPVYETVMKEVMTRQEQTMEIVIPAEYEDVEERRLVKGGGYSVWAEILCAEKTTASTIRKIQRALRARGYSIGEVDGMLGTRTQAALGKFQMDHELPVGNLNMETLAALNIEY